METIKRKIDAIKDVRDYLRAKYGESGGLLEAKNLIDSVIARQREAVYHKAYEAFDREINSGTYSSPLTGEVRLNTETFAFQKAFKAAIDSVKEKE